MEYAVTNIIAYKIQCGNDSSGTIGISFLKCDNSNHGTITAAINFIQFNQYFHTLSLNPLEKRKHGFHIPTISI